MLAKRCRDAAPASCARLLVCSHHAQWMPPPAAAAPTDSNNAEQQRGADDGDRELDGAGAFNPRGAYDRIICDVPCSGDGTVRKDAFARRKWRPSFGATLHHVQRRIALRSAALLRVGGVLTQPDRRRGRRRRDSPRGALELVDSGARAPALPRRPGLETWRVFDYDIPGRRARRRARHRASAATAERNSGGGDGGDGAIADGDGCFATPWHTRTLWPPTAAERAEVGAPLRLRRCMRFYPSTALDSGGFFVAIFRKLRPLPTRREMRKAAAIARGAPAPTSPPALTLSPSLPMSAAIDVSVLATAERRERRRAPIARLRAAESAALACDALALAPGRPRARAFSAQFASGLFTQRSSLHGRGDRDGRDGGDRFSGDAIVFYCASL